MIRRAFFIQKRPETTADDLKRAEETIRAVPEKIPGMTRTSFGANIGGRGGWTHIVELEFADAKAFEGYRTHPFSAEIMKWFGGTSTTRIVGKLEAANYAPFKSVVRQPRMKNLIRHVLLIQVQASQPRERVEEFEEVMMGLPRELSHIGNFALGRVLPEY